MNKTRNFFVFRKYLAAYAYPSRRKPTIDYCYRHDDIENAGHFSVDQVDHESVSWLIGINRQDVLAGDRLIITYKAEGMENRDAAISFWLRHEDKWVYPKVSETLVVDGQWHQIGIDLDKDGWIINIVFIVKPMSNRKAHLWIKNIIVLSTGKTHTTPRADRDVMMGHRFERCHSKYWKSKPLSDLS